MVFSTSVCRCVCFIAMITRTEVSYMYFQTTNDKANLVVGKAVRGDTGKYTLKLKNDSGVVEGSFNVTVIGRYM